MPRAQADPEEAAETRREFAAVVNMSPAALRKWLGSDESRSVGWTHEGESEAVGHQEGRRILAIKGKKAAEITPDDLAHMRRVIGYVHRHLAQGGPAEDKEHSRWRYSLMNWGHDPLKSPKSRRSAQREAA